MKLAGGVLALLLVLAAVAAYTALGYFTLGPNEQAVVLRLGRYARTLEPGPHFYAPGLEEYRARAVTETKEEEFGYRTVSSGPPPEYEIRPDERRMLTGDENLVNVDFAVQYRVKVNALRAYLFNVVEVTTVIRDVALSSMREEIAKRPIDDVFTAARGDVEDKARARMQKLLDAYGAGVEIQSVQLQDVEAPEAVKDAFAEVTSAEQDRERLILEAEGYQAEVVPRARGEAQAIRNQADAYRQRRVLEATGEADRFLALLAEYKKAPEVMRARLYIETLEEILPRMDKVIVEEGQGERIIPYLPLGRRGVEP